ncbi:hypothetical protein ABHN84_20775 [Shewanella vesiculosa]|uniref:Uncharacterized protein n=1 Tax=Shewanella vesiculosa TaxID=518738 RepID=A0ABV0FV42_9GAMM
MFSKLKSVFIKKKEIVKFRYLDEYFMRELKESSFNLLENEYLILRHWKHEEKLDLEKICTEFSVGMDEAKFIFSLISEMYYKAACEKAWDDAYLKMYNTGLVKEATLISAQDSGHKHCFFCSEKMNKKLPITTETYLAFQTECRCKPYKKSFFKPFISFK